MRVLLLDNDDSFTWNLWQLIRSLGADCDVVHHRETSIAEIKQYKPDRIVISPGPGGPAEALLACEVIRKFGRKIPILGVCLGHQCLAHVFGGRNSVMRAPSVMHGKTSKVLHGGTSIFSGVPSPLKVARYHSLIVQSLPEGFELLCWTQERDASRGTQETLIMAMRHKTLPLFGVQFHPESFLTEYGEELMRNFLYQPSLRPVGHLSP